jgi:glycerol-3-phosphate dehydrogenase
VQRLAARVGVDMPICTEVYRVLHEQRDVLGAVQALLGREPSAEL